MSAPGPETRTLVSFVAEELGLLHSDVYESFKLAHEAGWRIVRAADTDREYDDDSDSPTYGLFVPVWTIAEEWTP